jgi:hypothetical protein
MAVFTALLLILASTAVAQKNELEAGVARTYIPSLGIKPGTVVLTNNSVNFNHGIGWEINYARHLLGTGFLALDAEVPVVGNPEEDLGSGNGAVPRAYSSIFITPAARVRFFAQNAIQLWVSGGGGLGYWTMSNTLVYGGINPGAKSRNSGVVQAGAGLDIRPWRHLGFRLAARDFYSGSLPLNVITVRSHQHSVIVTGGVVWSF